MRSPGTGPDPLENNAILEQMKKIENSVTFRNTPRQRDLLHHLVQAMLAGNHDQLKGPRIADKLFKSRDDVMRNEAGRLRKQLFEYYGQEGRSDPIRIGVPKGTYVPTFSLTSATTEESDVLNDAISQPRKLEVVEHLGWNVPPQNRFFTGRDEYLESLHAAFARNSQSRALKSLAITGVSGVGKTQTAIEYAYRYKNEYRAGIWINANTRDLLLSGFLSAAHLLDLPERHEKDLTLVAESVLRWLRAHTDWLVIFDNAEDLNLLRSFSPGNTGYCLITTRLPATGNIAEAYEIGKLSDAQGALLLLRRAKVISSDAPLGAAQSADVAAAQEITKELGGLPLALDHAGAFVEETTSTVGDYLGFYRAEGPRLRARDAEVSEHSSVTITFSLGFQKLEAANAAAADLVNVSAFLAPEAIPEEIFTECGNDIVGTLGQLYGRPILLAEAVGEAARLGLIRRNPVNRTIDVHRLVQEVIKDGMNDEVQQRWILAALRALAKIFPQPNFKNWKTCERLVAHGITICGTLDNSNLEPLEGAHLFRNCGLYLHDRAQYQQAGKLLTRSLTIREKVLGPEHPDTATSLSDLAALKASQGFFQDAKPLHKRALGIREKVLGPEHPDTATSLHELADLERDQILSLDVLGGAFWKPDEIPDIRQIEELTKRALNIREKVLGPEHPDTATSLRCLADVYRDQQRFNDAEELYTRALRIRKKALGDDDPLVAVLMNKLALLYEDQQRYEDAEPLHARAINLLEKAYGPEHPWLANCLGNYSEVLRHLGRDREAEELRARATSIRAKLVNWQTSEKLKHIVELIDKSSILAGSTKEQLKEEIRCWGLHDRVRALIKAICLEGLRELQVQRAEAIAILQKKKSTEANI